MSYSELKIVEFFLYLPQLSVLRSAKWPDYPLS